MTAEAWIGLIAIGVVVVGAVVASYVLLRSALARVETKLGELERRAAENRDEHGRIWDRLDGHTERITRLEPRNSIPNKGPTP